METSTAFGAKSYFFTYKIGNSRYLIEKISSYDKEDEEIKLNDAISDKEREMAENAAAHVNSSSNYMDVKKVYCVHFEDENGKLNIFLFLDGNTKKANSLNTSHIPTLVLSPLIFRNRNS